MAKKKMRKKPVQDTLDQGSTFRTLNRCSFVVGFISALFVGVSVICLSVVPPYSPNASLVIGAVFTAVVACTVEAILLSLIWSLSGVKTKVEAKSRLVKLARQMGVCLVSGVVYLGGFLCWIRYILVVGDSYETSDDLAVLIVLCGVVCAVGYAVIRARGKRVRYPRGAMAPHAYGNNLRLLFLIAFCVASALFATLQWLSSGHPFEMSSETAFNLGVGVAGMALAIIWAVWGKVRPRRYDALSDKASPIVLMLTAFFLGVAGVWFSQGYPAGALEFLIR